ncbi:hypothetical protein Vau01_015090 [Virgisporangium aurantiacum]|uniref:O-antigen ligase n=1 Tax=Virgisporangium aurantiacum TaxID=175570 RepID=A0A8J3Z2T2_9ACTN|nr:hypothetical protein Vau01_015090 [Virgisporangium aurantiacum]
MTPAAGIVGLLTVAALGPYTPVTGVRTEQIAVYATFGFGLLRLNWIRGRAPARLIVPAVLMAALAFIAIVGSVDRAPNLTGFVSGGLIAGLDNVLLPVATIGAVWFVTTRCSNLNQSLLVVCRIVVWAAVVNTVAATMSITMDLTPVLARFWENGSAQAVAERAAQLGRFTGIFNQPAEAGLFYGIALIVAVFLYRANTVRLAFVTPVILAGGVLTVSKVFLLVGLPIGLFQLLRTRGRRALRLVGVGATVLIGSLAAVVWSETRWTGGTYLARLFVPPAGGSSAVDLYTAGRLGDDSTLRALVESVLDAAPSFGVGVQGLAVAYDNGWVEALVVGGLVGAVVYSLVLSYLLVVWRLGPDGSATDLLGGLALLLLGASMGLPALTANRVATIVWILIALLLARPQVRSGAAHQRMTRPANGSSARGPSARAGLRIQAWARASTPSRDTLKFPRRTASPTASRGSASTLPSQDRIADTGPKLARANQTRLRIE